MQTTRTDKKKFGALLIVGFLLLTGAGTGLTTRQTLTGGNLLLFSEQVNNAVWTPNFLALITPDSSIAPNGSITADKLVEAAATAEHYVDQPVFVSNNNTVSASVYAKPAERSWLSISITQRDGVTGKAAFFNLATGAVGSGTTTAGVTATNCVASLNAFYRCSISVSVGSGGSNPHIRIKIATSDGVSSYLGDGSSGIYVWGAAVEPTATAGVYVANTTSTSPSAVDLSSLAVAKEGTSFAHARADHTHAITGTLAEFQGGTGAGALTCSAGQVLSSNGTSYSCGDGSLTCSAGQAVTGSGAAFSCTSALTASALAGATAYSVSGPSNVTALGVTSLGTGTAVTGDGSGGTGYGIVGTGNTTRAPFRAVPLTAAPSTPQGGDFYFDSTLHALSFYDGVASWVPLAAGGVGILADAPLSGAGTSASHLTCPSATSGAGGCVSTAAQTFAGAKTFNGGIVVGSGGTAISSSPRGTLSWTPGSLNASCTQNTVTVTGAVNGTECSAGWPSAPANGLMLSCATGAGNCTLTICNGTAIGQTPPSGTYTCRSWNP